MQVETALKTLHSLAKVGQGVVLANGKTGSIQKVDDDSVTIRCGGVDTVHAITDTSKPWMFSRGTFASLSKRRQQALQQKLLDAKLQESEARMREFWTQRFEALRQELRGAGPVEDPTEDPTVDPTEGATEDDYLSSELDLSDEELFGK